MQPHNIAVIDTGTNTFHLLIINVGNNGHKIIYRITEPVRLGKNGIGQNQLAPEAFQRGVETFKKFKAIADEFNAEKIFSTGTAALRRAKNASNFIETVKSNTGISINIISGDEEACLIWYGVKQAMELPDHPSLIMDIGGGSTEFIIANSERIFWKKSFDAGVSLLLEKFCTADPIGQDDILKLEKFFTNEFAPLKSATEQFKPNVLIGASGSFETLSEIISWRNNQHEVLSKSTSYHFDLNNYHQLHHELILSNLEQRLATKGMIPIRAEMMVVGSVMINFVIRTLGISQMHYSAYALKEGLLFSLINNQMELKLNH